MKSTAMFLALTLSGCAMAIAGGAAPTADDIANADFGAAPDDTQLEEIVKAAIAERLLDPYSAVYTVQKPQRAWWAPDKSWRYGYAICGTVNAKNRMGGYVGVTPYIVFYDNGTTYGELGPSRGIGREAIANKCSNPMGGPFPPYTRF